jgi:hypothetical protein
MKELSSDFITSNLIGNLGNQMFQIAHGYSQALKHNRQFVVPTNDTGLDAFRGTIYKDLDFLIHNTHQLENVARIQGEFHFKPVKPVDGKITVFHGFYQSEKYFLENKNEVKNLFSPSNEFRTKCFSDYPALNAYNTVAINVRRGDYLTQSHNHPVVTLEYILKGLELIPNKDHIFVVSDDIPWCKENIKLDNTTFVHYTILDALWFLSYCRHFVMSNSTFSWWAAYLGEKEDSITVFPSTWFGPGVHQRGHYETDIFKENWKLVPTVFDNGWIKLKT